MGSDPELSLERVLVVSDDKDLVESVRDVLEMTGATVETATSARQAESALARGFVPSVALVDVRPGGGTVGERVITRLRSLTPSFAVRIIAMSGDARAFRSFGDFAELLLKPFSADELVRRIVRRA